MHYPTTSMHSEDIMETSEIDLEKLVRNNFRQGYVEIVENTWKEFAEEILMNEDRDRIVIEYVDETGNIKSFLSIKKPKQIEADFVRGSIHHFLTSIGILDYDI